MPEGLFSTSWIWSVLSMNSQQNGQRTRYSAQIYRKRKTKHVRKSCRFKDAPTKTHLVWSRLCDHWRRTITLSWELWKHENKTHTDTLHIHVYLSLLFLAHLLCLFVQMCVFFWLKRRLCRTTGIFHDFAVLMNNLTKALSWTGGFARPKGDFARPTCDFTRPFFHDSFARGCVFFFLHMLVHQTGIHLCLLGKMRTHE